MYIILNTNITNSRTIKVSFNIRSYTLFYNYKTHVCIRPISRIFLVYRSVRISQKVESKQPARLVSRSEAIFVTCFHHHYHYHYHNHHRRRRSRRRRSSSSLLFTYFFFFLYFFNSFYLFILIYYFFSYRMMKQSSVCVCVCVFMCVSRERSVCRIIKTLNPLLARRKSTMNAFEF